MATKKPSPSAEAAPKDSGAGEAPAAKKRKKSGLAPILAVAALVLAGGGGAAWYFLLGPGKGGAAAAETAKAEKAAPKKVPTFVALEPFTVNLQDEDGAHYLQVAVVLSATDAAAVDAIKVHMPVIRNGVLLLLSSKRSDELATLPGKQKLAAEIVAEARRPLAAAGAPEGVESVYFSSFVIQ
jgi:flagellar FliL protein